MVIGVCGFGYTGSGAVIDLLKEYCDIQVLDCEEFGIAYRPDGLEDLKYHLFSPSRYMASDVAISRFTQFIDYTFRPTSKYGNVFSQIHTLTREYIASIVQVQWKGCWSWDVYSTTFWKKIFKWHLLPIIDKILNHCCSAYIARFLIRPMYLSSHPQFFVELTRKYVTSILNILGYDDKKILVINQAFSADNPLKSFNFFVSPKAIIVDRDPRDLYFLCKKELIADCLWVPTDDIDDFIAYYACIRHDYYYLNAPNILLINFESLIYEYTSTINKIESFIGLKSQQHVLSKQYFSPSVSENNTQLFRKYSDYKKDIEKIEKNLQQFLYPYNRYTPKTQWEKSF